MTRVSKKLGPRMLRTLGAVVRGDGYIITKASELKGELECQLFSGKRLPAQLLARDSALDLDVLKIDAQNLPEVRWAEADQPVGSLLRVEVREVA